MLWSCAFHSLLLTRDLGATEGRVEAYPVSACLRIPFTVPCWPVSTWARVPFVGWLRVRRTSYIPPVPAGSARFHHSLTAGAKSLFYRILGSAAWIRDFHDETSSPEDILRHS
jgi:hypothetical protein